MAQGLPHRAALQARPGAGLAASWIAARSPDDLATALPPRG